MKKLEIEFLKESNAIEKEYSTQALEDAKIAWNYAKNYIPKYQRINIPLIVTTHAYLLRNLNPKIAGKIRTGNIYIGRREGYKPLEIKKGLKTLCNQKNYPIYSENLIKKWHIQFEKIHPFQDGNGRTGRIIMNIQRLKKGFPILVIHEGEEQMEYYKWFRNSFEEEYLDMLRLAGVFDDF